jgi:outer membrane protein
MKRILTAFLIASIATCQVIGQKKWTLQECIQYALDNNIQVKRQELQTEITKTNYEQSKMEKLPNLTADASHNWNFGRSTDRFTNQILTSNVMSDNFSIQSSVLLFSGFQIKNTIEQNKYLVEQSLQDFQKTKNDISIRIATIYLQILFDMEALDIAEKQLDVTKLQVEKTKKLVDAGSKPKGELLQIQAQQANEVYNVTNAKNNLKISYLTLAQLLELKSSEGMDIVIPDTIQINNLNVLSSVDDIYNDAITKLPEVKSAEFNVKSAEKGLEITKGQYLPTLSLTAAYYTGYSDARKKYNYEKMNSDTLGYVNNNVTLPVIYNSAQYSEAKYSFFDQIKDNNSKAISFSLSIPIFNRFQTRSNVSKAKIRVLDANYNVEQTKKNLYQEIQKAHADATAAFEMYNSASEAVASNEESFKYIQQKYDVGLVSSVDYNIAKNDLIKAKSNNIQAKYQFIFKLKVLDFYKGLPLQL